MGKKHTPGPWWIWQEEALKKEGLSGEEITEELVESRNIDHCIYAGSYEEISRSHMKGGSFTKVVNINDFDDANEDPEVALANARLIAAAPDMLRKLKAYRGVCKGDKELETIIAKAEGKEAV